MRFKVHPSQPKGFGRLAKYLAGRTQQLTPDRVEWSFGLNLQTIEPDAAAAIMEATAARNTRCQAPAYHFMVSFDPADASKGKVSPEVMREIAEDVIKRMGLSDYQGLVYAHKDKTHPHIHFLINRIHPEHGKALSRHEDGKRLHKICREIARERGLNIPKERESEKSRSIVDDLDTYTPTDGEYWQAKRESRDPKRLFTKEQILSYRKDLRPMFHDAQSWDDLSARLRKSGLFLQAKGQGLIITDGDSYLKLSDLHDRALRLPELAIRFKLHYEEFASRQELGKQLAYELRDLPTLPNLEGMSKEEQNSALALHKAKVKAVRGRRTFEEQKDLMTAFDATDGEMRYWMLIRESYQRAEKRVETEKRRKDRQESIAIRAGGNVSVEEGRMFGAMGKVYINSEEAHEKWQKLEKEKGHVMAAEMVLKKPRLLGDMHITLFSSYKSRLAAQRALDTMLKRRKRWYLARERLEGVRNKQQEHYRLLQKYIKDHEYIQRVAGPGHVLEEILVEKIKARAKVIDRLNPRMFEHSKIADERLRQLKKSYRDYHEKKMHRERALKLERDLWGR